jgi:hypothetical protein
MFSWVRRLWGRRPELSLLNREPIRLLLESTSDGSRLITVEPAPLAQVRETDPVEILPDTGPYSHSSESKGPEVLPPLEFPRVPDTPAQVRSAQTINVSPTIVLPQPDDAPEPRIVSEPIDDPVRREHHATADSVVEGPVIITPPPASQPMLTDVATPSSKITRDPIELKSLLEWRDPGYFQPGAYAARWGMDTVLRLPAGRPPTRSAAAAKSAIPVELAAPVEVKAKRTEAFSFLPQKNAAPSTDTLSVDAASLTEFLLTREEEASPEAARYWTDPVVLARAHALMTGLLARPDEGLAPITPQEMLKTASIDKPDAMALLVCHNLARAFARGSAALTWRAIDPARGLYRKGEQTFRASRVREPIFYEIFDAPSLQGLDPGDWYRFFGIALATAFAAGAKLSPVPDRALPPLTEAVDVIARQILALLPVQDNAASALAWVNAMQFWERGLFCSSEETIRRGASQGLAAFQLGLECCGEQTDKPWTWQLPRPLSLAEEEPRTADVTRTTLGVEHSLQPPERRTNRYVCDP